MKVDGKIVHKVVIKPTRDGCEVRLVGKVGRGSDRVLASRQAKGQTSAQLLDALVKENEAATAK